MLKKRVLIVEDESIIAMSMENTLEQLNYEVAGTLSYGEEVYPRAKTLLPDVILMDISLKGKLNGIQVSEKISRELDIPVILITGHYSLPILRAARRALACAIIRKPFSDYDLQNNIEAAFVRDNRVKRLKENYYDTLQLLENQKQTTVRIRDSFFNTFHQVQTSLVMTSSYFNLIEEDLSKHVKESDRTVKSQEIKLIQNELSRAYTLMRDTLSMSKQLNANIIPKLQQVDVYELVKQIAKTQYMGDTSLAIKTKGIACHLFSDPELLHQSITNVVNNAIKYSEDMRPPRLRIYYEETTITIEVKDYGIGIPKEDQRQLFTPFYRGRNTAFIDGTGLGLVVVKKNIELLHGNVKIISELNKGTTVSITLPKLNAI